jgi:hypothetical protein
MKQQKKEIFHPISARARGIKTSLYADDAAIFISPVKQDIVALKASLTSLVNPRVYEPTSLNLKFSISIATMFTWRKS